MSCCIQINKITYEISEAELVGIFCSIFDCFGENLSDSMFNVEISYIKGGKLLPKFLTISWTLYNKLCSIKNYCSSLKMPKDNHEILTVIPFTNKKNNDKGNNEQIYYLENQYIEDFITGYSNLFEYLRVEKAYIIDKNNYVDQFIPDNEMIHLCKLVTKNKNNRNFIMDIPCYLWDLPMYSADMYTEQLIINLINLFLKDCDTYNHQLLLANNHFLKISICQDNQDSKRYCYAHIQDINRCTFDSHKKSLKSISKTKLACEIIFSKRGFFFEFPIIEWINKYVYHVIQFD